jgi:hypothetical protein
VFDLRREFGSGLGQSLERYYLENLGLALVEEDLWRACAHEVLYGRRRSLALRTHCIGCSRRDIAVSEGHGVCERRLRHCHSLLLQLRMRLKSEESLGEGALEDRLSYEARTRRLDLLVSFKEWS